MISFAKVLAARLGGAVVDDTNQPLSDAALGEIAGQVQAFCSDMENLGVAAGSPRALRLFNYHAPDLFSTASRCNQIRR